MQHSSDACALFGTRAEQFSSLSDNKMKLGKRALVFLAIVRVTE